MKSTAMPRVGDESSTAVDGVANYTSRVITADRRSECLLKRIMESEVCDQNGAWT
jgi:hypothetical protein